MKKYIFSAMRVILFSVFAVFMVLLLNKIGLNANEIVATIISLYSLTFVALTTKITKDTLLHTVEHDIRSVTPFLQSFIDMENGDKEIKISLRNSGIGPACIQKITVDGFENALRSTKNIVAKQLNDESKADKIVRGIIQLNGCLLAPNEYLLLVHLRFDDITDSDRLQILEQVSQLKIHVEYLDIYELQFLQTNKNSSDNKKPARPYTLDANLSSIYIELVEPYKLMEEAQ